MIDRELAKEQIARIGRIKGFPYVRDDDPIAKAYLKELVDAVQSAATPLVAVAVMDDLVRTVAECPPPSLIRNAMRLQAEQTHEHKTRPTQCRLCGDSGFVTEARENGNFARRCVCRK